MTSAALERVDFQVKSPLATKVVAACQAAMDEVKASRFDPNEVTEASDARISKTSRMLKKSLVPSLVKIFKDELNLAVSVELIAEFEFIQACTYTEYSAYSGPNDWMAIVKGYEVFEGTSDYDHAAYDVNYFKERADDLDLEVSKMKKYSTETVTHLYLYTTSFMGEEIVKANVVTPITPEEIAAVILHEIGHALTIIEHLANTYHRSEVATNTIKYLNERADDKTLSTVVEQLNASDKLVSDEAAKANGILATIKGSLSRFAPAIAVMAGCLYVVMVLVSALARLDESGKYGILNSRFKKTSDTVVTESNPGHMERIADEFVSRHGLGAPLATVLAKMSRYWESGHEHDTFAETVKALGMIKATLLSYKIVTNFLLSLICVADGTYDPDWLRLEHILQNNMVVFKDDKLPPEVRSYFLKETKTLIEVVEKFKSRNSFKLKQLIMGTIFRILSRSSIIDSFATASLSSDYDKLQLLTNGLVKNKLLYHAARLKNL